MKVRSDPIGNNDQLLTWRLKMLDQRAADFRRDGCHYIRRRNSLRYDFMQISGQRGHGIFGMFQKSEVMDRHDLTYFLVERRQDEIGAMIDIRWTCKKRGWWRHMPTIP